MELLTFSANLSLINVRRQTHYFSRWRKILGSKSIEQVWQWKLSRTFWPWKLASICFVWSGVWSTPSLFIFSTQSIMSTLAFAVHTLFNRDWCQQNVMLKTNMNLFEPTNVSLHTLHSLTRNSIQRCQKKLIASLVSTYLRFTALARSKFLYTLEFTMGHFFESALYEIFSFWWGLILRKKPTCLTSN